MTQQTNEPRKKRNIWVTMVIITAVFFLYPIAIQATEINLNEPLEPKRQENLISLIRDLARPDLFRFANETRSTNISIRMPCPEEIKGSQVSFEGRVITLAPNCATTTQDQLTLTGSGFPPNVQGAVLWYPAGSDTTRRLAEIRADSNGDFAVTFTMPDVRPTEEPQRIEVVEILSKRIIGFSDASKEAFDKIIETVLMALMASTIGTILAVPISFLAARNLMEDVKLPLAAIMAAIIALPFGGWLGQTAGSILANLADQLSSQTIVGLGAFVVSSVIIVPLMRFALPGSLDEKRPSLPTTLLAITASLLLGIFSLSLLADLGLVAGSWLRDNLGLFAFIGNFIYVLSDLLRVLMPAIIGFIGAVTAASYASRYGQEAILQLPRSAGQMVTLILTSVGTAVFIFAIEYFINWICLFELCNLFPQTIPDLWVTMGIPAIVIGLIAGALTMRQEPKRPFPIGALTYNATRSFLNGTRSIEPVLLGFVLVVWVGLGPFAGILALTISSVADLGKLFSEQVENISQGPIEAITATGANRLQTIVYAVIPQIVPHYIAFAFYRWDINVRMATIIGFVGGGGIGFVLFRSTNLTQYRAASVMVIAIALVVTTLDYISAKIRSRII